MEAEADLSLEDEGVLLGSDLGFAAEGGKGGKEGGVHTFWKD